MIFSVKLEKDFDIEAPGPVAELLSKTYHYDVL